MGFFFSFLIYVFDNMIFKVGLVWSKLIHLGSIYKTMWMFQTSKALWLLINLIVQCSSNLHPGFSRLEQGHRLDGSVINSFPEFSFLDCVTECLVSPRCASVNYFKGANFCELNYKKKQTAYTKFTESPGWVYSDRDHWPEVITLIVSNCVFLTFLY